MAMFATSCCRPPNTVIVMDKNKLFLSAASRLLIYTSFGCATYLDGSSMITGITATSSPEHMVLEFAAKNTGSLAASIIANGLYSRLLPFVSAVNSSTCSTLTQVSGEAIRRLVLEVAAEQASPRIRRDIQKVASTVVRRWKKVVDEQSIELAGLSEESIEHLLRSTDTLEHTELVAIFSHLCRVEKANWFLPTTPSLSEEVLFALVHQLQVKFGSSIRDVLTDERSEKAFKLLQLDAALATARTEQVVTRTEGMVKQLLQPQLLGDVARVQFFENIPPKNPAFIGRIDKLQELQQLLPGACVALTGMAGVGKSQTAFQFAHDNRENYEAIFRIIADSRRNLFGGYRSIFARIKSATAFQGDSDDPQVQDEMVRTVRTWLENHRSLLILDNVEDITATRSFIPSSGLCSVLMTMRQPSLASMALEVRLDEMDHEEGALLLLRSSGSSRNIPNLSEVHPDDLQSAIELSRDLGGLPLALDQAAAFIQLSACSIKEYLELYRQEGSKYRATSGGGSGKNRRSVTATFNLSLRSLHRKDSVAATLVKFCAFFAPDAIPENVHTVFGFEQQAFHGVLARERWLTAVTEATRLALLRRDAYSGTLSIHRLVRDVIRDGMDIPEKREWVASAVAALDGLLPYPNEGVDDSAVAAVYENLLPHARAVIQDISDLKVNNLSAAAILYKTGRHLVYRNGLVEAETYLRASLRLREDLAGLQSFLVGDCLDQLALICEDQAKYEEAEALIERQAPIWATEQNPERLSLRLSIQASRLGIIYLLQERYKEAEDNLLKAISILVKLYGDDHAEVGRCYYNLGLTYFSQHFYDEAEEYYMKALLIQKKRLASNDPSLILTLNAIGTTLDARGQLNEALSYLLKTLVMHKAVLGEMHVRTLANEFNVAKILFRLEEYQEAEESFKRTLTGRTSLLRLGHPHICEVQSALAQLYVNRRRYTEAEALYMEAMHQADAASDAGDALMPINNLARFYFERGQYDKAEPLYRRLFTIAKKPAGLANTIVLGALTDFVQLLHISHRDHEAEEIDFFVAELWQELQDGMSNEGAPL